MQEVLVDRGQFVLEYLVDVLDDSGVAFHDGRRGRAVSEWDNCKEIALRCGAQTADKPRHFGGVCCFQISAK